MSRRLDVSGRGCVPKTTCSSSSVEKRVDAYRFDTKSVQRQGTSTALKRPVSEVRTHCYRLDLRGSPSPAGTQFGTWTRRFPCQRGEARSNGGAQPCQGWNREFESRLLLRPPDCLRRVFLRARPQVTSDFESKSQVKSQLGGGALLGAISETPSV